MKILGYIVGAKLILIYLIWLAFFCQNCTKEIKFDSNGVDGNLMFKTFVIDSAVTGM